MEILVSYYRSGKLFREARFFYYVDFFDEVIFPEQEGFLFEKGY